MSPPPESAAVAAVRAAPAKGGLLSKVKPPHLFSGLITVLLVIGQWRFQILPEFPLFAGALGFLNQYVVLLTSLATAIGMELVLSRTLRGTWPSVLSAYISGNSIVILTKPQSGILWPFVLGSAIAILSKYVLTFRGRHLWNPTNFAISAMLLLAPGSIAILSHEWGNEWGTAILIWTIGFMVLLAPALLSVLDEERLRPARSPAGSIVVAAFKRAKLLHITLTYFTCFLLLGGVRAAIVGGSWLTEITPVTGAMYSLLMFFMLTDPRTTVSTGRGRITVVVSIALLECALRLGLQYHQRWAAPFAAAPPIFALAILGPLAMVLDLRRARA